MRSLTWSEVADPPCPGRRTSQPLHGDLAGVVRVLENAIGRPQGNARWRTPSAGGIYPYEVFLAAENAPRRLVHADLHRRVVTMAEDSAAAIAGARGFLFALCGRPWLSMRAYGRRGFLYHLIDLGHAVFNAALLCEAGDPEITRGVKHFAGAIGALSPTAQIACIDHTAAETGAATGIGWRLDIVHTGGMLPYRTEYETAHTRSLNTASRERLRRLSGDGLPELRAVIEQRRSAKRFQVSAEADDRIAKLLDALPDQLAATAAGLGLPASCVRVLAPDMCADLLPTARDATAALAQQEHLAPTRAYLVFGLDQGGNRAIDRSARRQLLSIGAASELIYLEAARAGIDVTGVGGIDPRVWRDITGIDMPLYLVALGVETDVPKPVPPAGNGKLDRMNVIA